MRRNDKEMNRKYNYEAPKSEVIGIEVEDRFLQLYPPTGRQIGDGEELDGGDY